VEEGIWKVRRGRGRYNAICGDLSGRHLESTEEKGVTVLFGEI